MSYTMEEVVKKYVDIRDRKKALEKEHEEALEPLNEALKNIEAWVLAKMATDGVNSYKTEEGTAYKSIKTSVTTADAQMFREFVFEPVVKAVENVLMTHGVAFDHMHEAVQQTVMQSARWGIVDMRPGKKGIEEMVQDGDPVPPGLNMVSVATVGVRRS